MGRPREVLLDVSLCFLSLVEQRRVVELDPHLNQRSAKSEPRVDVQEASRRAGRDPQNSTALYSSQVDFKCVCVCVCV